MRVLVTGASGCLGRAAVRELTARGHCVRGTARSGARGESAHEWVTGELAALDLAALSAGCDAVVHLAALVHSPAIKLESAYLDVNARLTSLLLAAARPAPGAFVLASTVGVYGVEEGDRLDEASPVAPKTPYARSKLAAEHAVLERGGTVLRLPVAYGPGDRGNVARLTRALARGRFVLPGAGSARRSLVSAENAARALADAVAAAVGGVFLVTDDDDLTLAELVQTISDALGVAPPLRAPVAILDALAWLGSASATLGVPAPLTRQALHKLTRTLTFDCTKSKRLLGYRPRPSRPALAAAALEAIGHRGPR